MRNINSLEMTASEVVKKLRKQWSSYPKKFAAIQKQAIRLSMNDGRMKTFIQCGSCEGLFPRHLIEAHHIVEVGSLLSTSPADIEAFKQRLFCSVAGIQALCTICHKQVSRLQLKN